MPLFKHYALSDLDLETQCNSKNALRSMPFKPEIHKTLKLSAFWRWKWSKPAELLLATVHFLKKCSAQGDIPSAAKLPHTSEVQQFHGDRWHIHLPSSSLHRQLLALWPSTNLHWAMQNPAIPMVGFGEWIILLRECPERTNLGIRSEQRASRERSSQTPTNYKHL